MISSMPDTDSKARIYILSICTFHAVIQNSSQVNKQNYTLTSTLAMS